MILFFFNAKITDLMAAFSDISAFENIKNVNYLYFRYNLTLTLKVNLVRPLRYSRCEKKESPKKIVRKDILYVALRCYSGISLLSCFGKLFTSCLNDRLANFGKTHDTVSHYCVEPLWPRGGVLGFRPQGFEFRILCLEDRVSSIISPSSGGSPGPV